MTLYSHRVRRHTKRFRQRRFRTFSARAFSARVYQRLQDLRAPSPCRMRLPEAPPLTKFFEPAIGHRRRRSSLTTSDIPLPLPLLCDQAVDSMATPVGGGTEAERANKQKAKVRFAPQCYSPRYRDNPRQSPLSTTNTPRKSISGKKFIF